MRPEEIMKALGGTDSRYLDQALERPAAPVRSRLRPLARLGLIAAVVTLLAGTAFAVATGMVSKERRSAHRWYELYFQENPAAEDAPNEILDFYSPTGISAGYRRELARRSFVDGRVVQAEGSWVCSELRMVHGENGETELQNLRKGQSTEPEEARSFVDAEATRWTDARVDFKYMPLKSLNVHDSWMNENVFAEFVTEDVEKITKSGERIEGRDYVVYSCQPGVDGGEAETQWYFWIDEARRYVFSLMFTEPVPEADRLAFLRAVTPMDEAAWERLMNPDLVTAFNNCLAAWNAAHPEAEPKEPIRLYLPSLRPEGYDKIQRWYDAWASHSALVDLPVDQWLDKALELGIPVSAGAELMNVKAIIDLHDGRGKSLRCAPYAASYIGGFSESEQLDLIEDTFRQHASDSTLDRFTLDGREILRVFHGLAKSSTLNEYESWIFLAPDGNSLLELDFMNHGAETPIPEDLKIAFFRSIEEVDPASLTPGSSTENGFFG